jgi:predicted peroxiredoxin
MSKKLFIVMANADPENPEEISAPLFQATVAAVMSHDVEVVLTGCTSVLATQGMAESLEINHESHRTIYDVIKEAHKAGVIFKLCTSSLEMWAEPLIPEIDEAIGSAYVVGEAMDNDTVTFTY